MPKTPQCKYAAVRPESMSTAWNHPSMAEETRDFVAGIFRNRYLRYAMRSFSPISAWRLAGTVFLLESTQVAVSECPFGRIQYGITAHPIPRTEHRVIKIF